MPVLQGNGRGDHRLLVNVAMPRRLSDKQRGLLEQFAQARRRGHLQRRRGLLRQAEERLPLKPDARLRRRSPPAEAERARAIMLELFPEGFEEAELAGGVELAAYTDPGGEERLWSAFGGARSDRGRGGLGGALARVPPAGADRRALGRPALGGARRRTRPRS